MSIKNILIKNGHIVKFRDGNYANYFENSLGKFLCLDKCVCSLNLNDYDESLLSKNREYSFCDIIEIYKVDSFHFFESTFESLKWTLDFQDKEFTKHKSIESIFKRD